MINGFVWFSPGATPMCNKDKTVLTSSVSPGDSSLNFLYYFATVTNKTHPGLARIEGSPVAGEASLL